MPSRRAFMKSSALAMFGVGAAPSWLSRAVYAKDAPSERKKILVAIFQRGAVDGLNMVVPYRDPDYYAARPSIAIPKPGNAEGCALDLDGHFALHPSLLSLKPLWERRELAIIQAVGSPDPTRSHFDAQDYMESGTPGLQSTGDGWLNRALVKEARPSPVRAVSLGSNLPKCLRGTNDALAIQSIEDFQVKDPRAAAAFERMYSESVDAELNGTARETFEAVRMMQSLAKSKSAPANGAQYPKGRLGKGLQQIARVIKANVGLEVAFTDVGGWDTHVNEVGARPHEGQLANLLREFGEGLAAFSQDLDDRMSDVTVVTMSEFGRTVRENGDRGTDHGHANVMLLLGGSVNGGKRYGQWPGLAREQLYEGRDLQITTDFRSVLAELVTRQLGNRDLATVFPGFRGAAAKGLLA